MNSIVLPLSLSFRNKRQFVLTASYYLYYGFPRVPAGWRSPSQVRTGSGMRIGTAAACVREIRSQREVALLITLRPAMTLHTGAAAASAHCSTHTRAAYVA